VTWGLRVRLFATIFLIYAIHFNSLHDNAQRYVYLMEALVEQHSIFVDNVPEASVYPGDDVVTIHGRRCADNNPGLSFLAAPFWAPVAAVLARPGMPAVLGDANVHYFIAHLVATLATTSLFATFGALLLAELVFAATRRRSRAIFAALLFAFGTIVFHHATHMNQNVPIAVIVLTLFVLLTTPEVLGVRRPVVQSALVGFLIGLAAFIDLSIVPFGVVALPRLWRTHRKSKTLLALAVGAAVPLLALAIFQYEAYGNPFRDVHYYYYEKRGRSGMTALLELDFRVFLDQIILPGHGLIAYSPFTALAGWYLVRAKARSHAHPDAGSPVSVHTWRFALAIVIAYLIFALINYGSRNTYFGPRYLMPIVPFLVWAFCIGAPSLRAPWPVALAGVSFYVGVAGAQLSFGSGNVFKLCTLYFLRAPWIPFFTWARDPIVQESGLIIPPLATPNGSLIFIAFMLAIIWLPFVLQRKPPATDDQRHPRAAT
jgi:hypothetical protein